MGRLIDADALKENIPTVTIAVQGMRSGKSFLHEVLDKYQDAILEQIDNAPTITLKTKTALEGELL